MGMRIAIALLIAVLYAWVIVVTMPYRRQVIQEQDMTDYYKTLDRDLEYANAQYEALKAKPNADKDQLLDAEERLALYHWEKREYDKAVVLYEDVVSKRTPAPKTPYDERYAMAALRLAGIYRDVNNWEVSERMYKTVLDYDKTFFPDGNDTKIARDLNNLGLLYYLKGTSQKDEKQRNQLLKQSSDYLNQAIKIYKAKNGPGSPSEAISLWNLYLAERDQGNEKIAESFKAEAEAIDAKMNRPCKAP